MKYFQCSFCIILFLYIKISSEIYWTIKRGDISTYIIEKGKDESGIAWAFYSDEINKTGWAKLFIETNSFEDDVTQMNAAGYLEGAITHERIYQSWINSVLFDFSNKNDSYSIPKNLTEWLLKNWKWMKSQVAIYRDKDDYWAHVELVISQLEGLTQGYNDYSPEDQQLSLAYQIIISSQGDIMDIFMALMYKKNRGIQSDIKRYMENNHCSALIKQTEDQKELFSAQTTWSVYVNMIRTYKIYTFHLSNPSTMAKTVSFSSYPGCLTSVDDFFITSKNLAIMETTNGIYNTSLYNYVTTASVLSWIRSIVANRMASRGTDWVKIFSRYNSGTYNNQWMIVDYNLFISGKQLQKNTILVLEQIPDLIESSDVSLIVQENGYWPSYNIPFFRRIYELSGFEALYQKYGSWFAYDENPRALIFKRDQGKVNSIEKLKWIIRYNNWQHDPLSQGNPGNAVASRFDLVTQINVPSYLSKGPYGAIDAKVTSAIDIYNLSVYAISGPTSNEQTIFRWTDEWSSVPHFGQPYEFFFDWHTFRPK